MKGIYNVGQALQEAEDWSVHVANLRARETTQDALEQTVLPLIRQVERLSLVCEAMWTLIQERTDLSDRDLSQRVTDLDLEDGVKDSRHGKLPVDCPDCGSKVCRKFNRCLFCGYVLPAGSAFDTV